MGAAESKLAFRKSIFRLAEEQRIPKDNDAFWSQFWTVPENAEDVFALVTPVDIRRIRDQSRSNFITLIEKTIDQMLRIMHAPGYPSPVHSVEALLNTIRLLTRLLPFLFEMMPDDALESKLFWTKSSDDANVNSNNSMKNELLGEQLMIAAIDLLFLKELTLPSTEATRQSRVNYLIWERGIAMKNDVILSKEIQQHRIEVLRLVLCLLSKAMYATPDGHKKNRWLTTVSACTDKKAKMALLCSLLNTVANYGSGRWQLPYQHVMFHDNQQQLATLSAQVLLVLLDQQVVYSQDFLLASPTQSLFSITGGDDDDDEDEDEGGGRQEMQESDAVPLVSRSRNPSTISEVSTAVSSHSAKDNLFQFYLARLHRPQDLQYLSDELYRIISQPLKARNSYLPNSAQPVTFQLEAILLFWHLYLNNEKFKQQVLNTHVADLSIAILYTALAHKLDPAQIGLVRLCVCVLQSFSSEPKFGKALNKIFVDETNLPAVARIPSFSGTFADYLIISVNTLITSTLVAAHKLVQLLNIFSSPAMLLADRHHPRRLILMADTLDRVVQYGFKDNPHVIYAIVRANDKIRLLKNFTLNRIRQTNNTTVMVSRSDSNSHRGRENEANRDEHQEETEMGEANVSPSSSASTTRRTHDTAPSPLSAKALGKLPVGTLPTSTPSTPITPITPTSIYLGGNNTSNNFVPTEEWVASWLPKVKLDRLLHMLDVVVPQVEALCSNGRLTSDQEILVLLRSSDLLEAVYPRQEVPSNGDSDEEQREREDDTNTEKTQLPTRPFQWNNRVAHWCRSLLWGHVYTMYRAPIGLWQGTTVQLFQVKSAMTSPSSSTITNSSTHDSSNAPTVNTSSDNTNTNTNP
ncbi:high-temperature-induced dauer-formation protein-domain-containing protein [Syncephalis fuscata]|nr:high-temperature-induced dauer-formation protein-domain-containing protein [Syncephalis fuscata]